MHYEGEHWRLDLPLPSLPGAHQIANAGIALACMEQLDGFSLPETAIAAGLRRIDWPARLQRLTSGPLVETLPSGWELWLDGGHNPVAGQVLAEAARPGAIGRFICCRHAQHQGRERVSDPA